MSGVVRTLGVVACALLVAAAACGGREDAAREPSATVDRVVDGDTLVVRGGGRVRLAQIDAPEAGGECGAEASTRELARLAPPGTTIRLEADPALDAEDRFGRLLRYVHAAERNVNVALVRRGAATPWFYEGVRGRYAQRLLTAVRSARAAGRGLWGACRVVWHPTRAVETKSR